MIFLFSMIMTDAFKMNNPQKLRYFNSNNALKMTNRHSYKQLAQIAISIGLYANPIITLAAPEKVEKQTTEQITGTNIVKDTALIDKITSLEKSGGKYRIDKTLAPTSNKPPASSKGPTNFRTTEELALFNFKQKYTESKSRLEFLIKNVQSETSKESKLKTAIAKSEKEISSIDKKMRSKPNEISLKSLKDLLNKVKSTQSEVYLFL